MKHQGDLLMPRPPRCAGYRAGESLALAEHAAAIYGDAETYRDACRRAGFDDAVFISSGAAQVGLAWSPGAIVITSRGTSGWGDWAENAMLWRWRWWLVEGRVHFGWRLQTGRLLRAVTAELHRLLDVHRHVFITGHSLGGAIALQLGGALQGHDPIIYAFEAPRVGDEAWSRWLASLRLEVYRVVHVAENGAPDIVTRLPLSARGWWHAGSPVILQGGKRYLTEAAWEDARRAGGAVTLPWWRVITRLCAGVGAHSVDRLVEELERQALTEEQVRG